jgi:hypothetical protein
MKFSLTLVSLLVIYNLANCQRHDVYLKVLAFSKYNNKQMSVKGATSDYNEKNMPLFNLVLGYTLFLKNTYELNFDYGFFKNRGAYTRLSQNNKEEGKQSSRWQHVSLSIGKRTKFNNILFLTSIGIPFETIYSNTQTSKVTSFDLDQNIIGTSASYTNNAPEYSTGIFFNQGIYYCLFSHLYFGFDFRIGVSYDKIMGRYYQTSTSEDLINQSTSTIYQESNLNFLKLSLPLMSNIGIRYTF